MRTNPAFRPVLLAILVALAWIPGRAAEIERLEPPFWWTGFEHSELQLLAYGPGIGSASVTLDYPGVSVLRTVSVESPNYLFVYLDVGPDANAAGFPIRFTTADDVVSYTFELRERDAQLRDAQGFSAADVIYLVTPDRFANGDPGNDYVEAMGDAPDRSEPYGRHGGDLAGISDNLDYISNMGFTSIWLNPILENDMPHASYHGYATTDYYRVDPRYGDNESYRQLVADARAKGLGIIMDMIANHIGTGHWWMDDLPTPDWLNYQDDIRITSHARTTNQDPYASAGDRELFASGWFVDSMPDLNQRNPLLADYLVQNSIWWVEYLGLHGIRQDTYPYPDKHFMSEWSRRIMQEYPNINIVGEEWSPNPNVTSYWQRGKHNHDGYVSHLPTVMDFPLQIALKESLTMDEKEWGSVWTDVYEMLGNDYLYPSAEDLLIFPDNHDMSRIYTQLDEDYELYRMALVFYLTMRGIPQIYYGTEILMSHPGTDSHGAIRSDFPGGWSGDRANAFTGKGLGREQREAQDFVRKLLQWRKSTPVIHDGKLMHYAPDGNVYVYFRYDDDDTVMVIFNRGDETATVDTERFSERLGDSTRAVDVISGNIHNVGRSITLEPRSVLLLEVR